jgi:hypothetical protein
MDIGEISNVLFAKDRYLELVCSDDKARSTPLPSNDWPSIKIRSTSFKKKKKEKKRKEKEDEWI